MAQLAELLCIFIPKTSYMLRNYYELFLLIQLCPKKFVPLPCLKVEGQQKSKVMCLVQICENYFHPSKFPNQFRLRAKKASREMTAIPTPASSGTPPPSVPGWW